MQIKIEQHENGEYYFLIPEQLQKELSWNEGDTISWGDNGDGSWTLSKLSQLDVLKLKAFEDPEVKAEYDRLEEWLFR
ncbi:hypothetical protein [Shewanella sp. CG12_big_fil_rev_8_21_14_0_65_47_15]|uniref:hypothetical protein n=1 Tax=Shewanella sp. CG12_big_fil_rev_8_21_14_0_65_47_15 TaxID=1975537 RepID=UPI000CC55CF4|nr:hypothetical protein [Shewanella sp. CG12_big_fil_rev_8_21_14_0_65_47_15]PIW60676.1 MAG: hypothetical protein COW15_12500 [Shewanella sp. CG12_big_fil_rev_8_21_14_0_65_47_15]